MRCNARAAVLLTCLALGISLRVYAVEFGPQGVLRSFCQADALGQRVRVAGWSEIAGLVSWPFEPAWDHVVLIGSYELGAPQMLSNAAAVIETRYAAIAQISASSIDTAVHLETVEFRMEMIDGAWRVVGPPPPPHIFASRVDVDSVRQSLQVGGLNFLPDSSFVWQMFQAAGWNVPLVSTPDLLNGQTYRGVEKPKSGDLVVYLREGVPYHVAIVEADDQVVSSTLNAGITRTAPEAFPGDLRYLRLVQPEPVTETIAVPPPNPPDDLSEARARVKATPSRSRLPSPTVKRGKRKPKSARSQAQHSRRRHVKQTKGVTVKRTPVAAGTAP